PGRYRFVVTAANADGVWSPVGAGLAIEVVPLFYETRWFAALVILLALGLVAGLGRLRFARIRARAEHLEREVAARTAQLARQAEALEALDELKTRFFAHISHELRTPLTLIAGAVDRLPDTAADDVTLDALRRNTRRLRRLTDQILELQRGEAGARRVTLEPVDLGALARATVAGF
ncbi:MAG: HAMP domain-containing histidine kinase, partial [Saprospiraceae bacterium]|nr:HAMP domain-containing histidine kinase [Saprospiraceae bacterium]